MRLDEYLRGFERDDRRRAHRPRCAGAPACRITSPADEAQQPERDAARRIGECVPGLACWRQVRGEWNEIDHAASQPLSELADVHRRVEWGEAGQEPDHAVSDEHAIDAIRLMPIVRLEPLDDRRARPHPRADAGDAPEGLREDVGPRRDTARREDLKELREHADRDAEHKDRQRDTDVRDPSRLAGEKRAHQAKADGDEQQDVGEEIRPRHPLGRDAHQIDERRPGVTDRPGLELEWQEARVNGEQRHAECEPETYPACRGADHHDASGDGSFASLRWMCFHSNFMLSTAVAMLAYPVSTTRLVVWSMDFRLIAANVLMLRPRAWGAWPDRSF